MITLLCDGTGHDVGRRLEGAALRRGAACTLVMLKDLRILPCTGCSSCSGPTFRHCVRKDDMQQLYPLLARGGTQVMITPILFGGYSAVAKATQERFSPLGDPRYYYRDGEMVKGMGQARGGYYAIGVKDGCSPEEKDTFLRFHRENLRIMDRPGDAWVAQSLVDDARLNDILEVLCGG